MNTNFPRVAVVLISHNRPDKIRLVLDSLVSQTYSNLTITVVENKSPLSEDIYKLVESYEGVSLIRNEDVGFCVGANTGFSKIEADWAYLAVDDITLDKDCIARLVDQAEKDPDVGMVCPTLYEFDAPEVYHYVGGDLSFDGRYPVIDRRPEDCLEQEARPYCVGFFPCCSILIRPQLMRKMGGFVESFYMCVEDVDLSARLTELKRNIWVVPTAKAYHMSPKENSKRPYTIRYHNFKNFLAVYLLHGSWNILPSFYFRYLLINSLRSLGSGEEELKLALVPSVWFLANAFSLLKERMCRKRWLALELLNHSTVPDSAVKAQKAREDDGNDQDSFSLGGGDF